VTTSISQETASVIFRLFIGGVAEATVLADEGLLALGADYGHVGLKCCQVSLAAFWLKWVAALLAH
jgi:hypothetical protein